MEETTDIALMQHTQFVDYVLGAITAAALSYSYKRRVRDIARQVADVTACDILSLQLVSQRTIVL